MSKNNRKKRMNSDNVKGYQREIISWLITIYLRTPINHYK